MPKRRSTTTGALAQLRHPDLALTLWVPETMHTPLTCCFAADRRRA
jgi:hypothetical protein